MEVFISWSGDRSGKVAQVLSDWLPNVIQSVRPFMSASDIEKGSRWSGDVKDHLDEAQFGLICLTLENLEAPWLLFEAGALSKSIKEDLRVVPYLYRVSLAQLQWPLAQFQAAVATKDDTLRVITSINEASGENGLEQAILKSAFETWWPTLEAALAEIPEATEMAPPPRTDRNILEEVLYLSRQMSRQSAPSSGLEQEALRNFFAHGSHTEPGASTEDSDAEYQASLSEYIRRHQSQARHRNLENARRRLSRLASERQSHDQPSSESEVRPRDDSDKEA